MFVMGHGGNTVTRMPKSQKGDREARSAGRRRSASDHLGGARRAQERHLSAAGRHQLRDQRLAHGIQPRDPVGRADRQADLRVEGRPRDHVSPGQEARLRRQDVQEHQGRGQSAGGRGHAARDQSRRLVDRLLRPVAGAAEVAHGAPGRLRHAHAEGRRPGRTRATITACRGRAGARRSSSIRARRCSTTPTCRSRKAAARSAPASASSARKRCPTAPSARSACSATAITPRTPRSRTAIRSSPRRAQEARLGQGPHRGRTGGDQQDQSDHAGRGGLGDRPVGRHPARRHRARLHPVRQRQGARQCVRLAGPDPGASRADLHAAAGTGREISDAARRQAVPRAQYRLHGAEGGGRQGHRQAVPAHPLVRPSGRIRRRRRGDPLQQVARRAAAGHVHRDQSCRCRRARHQGRRLGLGDRRGDTAARPAA